jgi:hypothetical protein
MTAEVEKVSAALFEKLRSRFDDVSVGDEGAKATSDPAKARFFNFDYISRNGENFGNVMISVIDTDSLKIFFGKNITAELDPEQKKEWYDFLRDIRMFAKRNLLSFDTRDISRSTLRIKDLKQSAQADSNLQSQDIMSESRLFGTSKTSYKKVGANHRLIIRHTAPVDETIQGSRSRKINAVYVETPDGERFKMPFNHLPACEALAQHVASEGQIHDDFGKHITDLVSEMGKIRKFIRGSRNKTFEDSEANDMVTAARERYHSIHKMLSKLRSPRGYQFYKESWKPAKTLQDDIDLETLRNKFVQKSFDERLDDALPHVYAAYHAMQQEKNDMAGNTHLDRFTEWADQVTEGTWAVPNSDEQVRDLQELMSQPLLAGVDGENATAALYDLLGDDDLSDRIYDASRGSPEMDVRPIIEMWLEDNMPDLAAKVIANSDMADEEPAPEPEQAPAPEAPPAEEPAPEQDLSQAPPEGEPNPDDIAAQMPKPGQTESVDHLASLRRLAGLK